MSWPHTFCFTAILDALPLFIACGDDDDDDDDDDDVITIDADTNAPDAPDNNTPDAAPYATSFNGRVYRIAIE